MKQKYRPMLLYEFIPLDEENVNYYNFEFTSPKDFTGKVPIGWKFKQRVNPFGHIESEKIEINSSIDF